jgi:hypothetical protein
MKGTIRGLLSLLLLAAPTALQAQFSYTNTDGSIYDYSTNADGVSLTITGYTGPPWVVTIPTNINTLPVTSIAEHTFEDDFNLSSVTIPGSVAEIGAYAFMQCISLTNLCISNGVSLIDEGAFAYCPLRSVVIPSSTTTIGETAFLDCVSLTNVTIATGVLSIGQGAFLECGSLATVTIPGSVTSIGDYAFESTVVGVVYFTGNAPAVGSMVFNGVDSGTAYYLPGTTGWGVFSEKTGLQSVLWNPLIQTGDGNFGVQNNQFGFNITGPTNITVVVEACTNLASPVWTPLQTVTLTNGLFYFSEPVQTNSSGRYYGLGFP